MAYTGGTAVARECIARLTELGALVDVYSKQWLSKHPNFPHFSEEDFAETKANPTTPVRDTCWSSLPALTSPRYPAYYLQRIQALLPTLENERDITSQTSFLSTWPHDKFCVLVSAGKITSSASPLMLTK